MCLLSILTWNPCARGWAVGALAVAGLAEAWTLLSVAITISQQNAVVMVGFFRLVLSVRFIESGSIVA